MSTSNTNPATFDFDDETPQEFLVCYRGQRYILTEPSEAAAINFRNASLKGAHFAMKDGKPSSAKMEGGAEAQAILLSGCLCQTIPDNNAPPHLKDKEGKGWQVKRDKDKNVVHVPIYELRGWSSKVVKPLFEKCKEIGDLGEKEEQVKVDTATNHDDASSESNGVNGFTSEEQSPKVQTHTMTSSP